MSILVDIFLFRIDGATSSPHFTNGELRVVRTQESVFRYPICPYEESRLSRFVVEVLGTGRSINPG